MLTIGANRVLGKKPVQVPLCPPQSQMYWIGIKRGSQSWKARSWASAAQRSQSYVLDFIGSVTWLVSSWLHTGGLGLGFHTAQNFSLLQQIQTGFVLHILGTFKFFLLV